MGLERLDDHALAGSLASELTFGWEPDNEQTVEDMFDNMSDLVTPAPQPLPEANTTGFNASLCANRLLDVESEASEPEGPAS